MRRLPLASAPSGSSEPTGAGSRRSIPALHPARCPGALARSPPASFPPSAPPRAANGASRRCGRRDKPTVGGGGSARREGGTGRGWQRAHHRERRGRSGRRGRLKCRGRGGARCVRLCRRCQRRPWEGEQEEGTGKCHGPAAAGVRPRRWQCRCRGGGRAGRARRGGSRGSGRPPLPGCPSPARPAEPPVSDPRVGGGAWRTGKGRARGGGVPGCSPQGCWPRCWDRQAVTWITKPILV